MSTEPDDQSNHSTAIDAAWQIHGAIMDWTGKVDAKASFTLGIESAILAGIITFVAANPKSLSGLNGWQLIPFWIGVVFLVLGILVVMVAVVPRLRGGALKKESDDNFIYFGHLRHWDENKLVEALLNQDMLPVLSKQLVGMSKIVWKKHLCVQRSLGLAIVGISCICIVVFGML